MGVEQMKRFATKQSKLQIRNDTVSFAFQIDKNKKDG